MVMLNRIQQSVKPTEFSSGGFPASCLAARSAFLEDCQMEITKEQLSQMYLGTELNCEEIGKLLNTSGSTIARRLRFYKILARKTHTDKAKEKMRNANLGKRYSIKTEFKKGHKWPKNIELQRGKNISKALKGRKGISPSEKTREKLSAAIRGAKSYLWKGGITPAVNKRIKDRFWRKYLRQNKPSFSVHKNGGS